MNRRALLLAAGILLLGTGTANAQFGVAVGANFDQFSDIEGNREATFDNATGFHLGLFYDLAFGPVSVRPGVFYVDVGDVSVQFDQVGGAGCALPGGGDCDDVFDLSLIEIPIDVRVRAMTPVVQPYALVGPVFRFANSGNDAFSDALNEFTYAGNIGAGVEVSVPVAGLRLYPEIRYTFGLASLTDDFTFLGADFETADEDQNLNTWMLRLGVAF